MEEPFRSVESIIELFQDNLIERDKLMKTINQIKANANEVS